MNGTDKQYERAGGAESANRNCRNKTDGATKKAQRSARWSDWQGGWGLTEREQRVQLVLAPHLAHCRNKDKSQSSDKYSGRLFETLGFRARREHDATHARTPQAQVRERSSKERRVVRTGAVVSRGLRVDEDDERDRAHADDRCQHDDDEAQHEVNVRVRPAHDETSNRKPSHDQDPVNRDSGSRWVGWARVEGMQPSANEPFAEGELKRTSLACPE